MLESIFSGLAVPIIDRLFSAGESTINWAGNRWNKSQIQQRFKDASELYRKKYIERHGYVKVLGMSQPVELQRLYSDTYFLDRSWLKSFSSIEVLEELYRKGDRRSFQVAPKGVLEGIAFANKTQYLMVLGAPGMGKSTFLKKMGLNALNKTKWQSNPGLIPVFIELKNKSHNTINLKKLVINEFDILGIPDSEDFVENALLEGKLLLLLDGLDEVPKEYRDSIVSDIRDFADKHSRNRYICSCRLACNISLPRFTDVLITEFNEKQIKQFITNWFSSANDINAGIGSKCWQLLRSKENASARELAQTPLLLTFLCLVYGRSQRLPSKRSTLYGKALDILLEEWAAEKRLNQEVIYEGFHVGIEKELLAEIAYSYFKDNQIFFDQRELVAQIASFLGDTLDAPKYLDGKTVLKEIELQQGILVERAEDVYSFSHLTLQEYLTAEYINSKRLENELLNKYLDEDRWREIVLLVSGLQGANVHDFLGSIECQSKNCIRTNNLEFLIDWINRVTRNSSSGHKPAAKRLAALILVISGFGA